MAKAAAGEKARKSRGRAENAIVRQLQSQLTDTLLPGENGPPPDELTEAAEFVLQAAGHRADGQASLLMRTAASGRRRLQIAVINRDMPFLVDSVAASIAAHGIAIDRLLHPVLPVRRDGAGKLVELPQGHGEGERRESMIYIETPRIDAKQRRALESDIRTTLDHVRAAVTDWPRMQQAIIEDADRMADAEGAALLRWLGGGMLTQLGHVTRKRNGSHGQMLGICRKGARSLLADEACRAAERRS